MIGKSRADTKLNAIEVGIENHKQLLVIISRQHPPEVTGYLAMQSFVQEILASNSLSDTFREKFAIIILPMLNPDRLDNGHWQYNLGGVDLNRDWQFYNQPEINEFQTYIQNVVKENNLQLKLGLDFHSTRHDLLYTFNEETYPSEEGIVKDWIIVLRKAFPNETIREEAGGSDAPVSKNWFLKEFDAESVTYEVGDDTARPYIKKKGQVSAQLIMDLLLKKHTP